MPRDSLLKFRVRVRRDESMGLPPLNVLNSAPFMGKERQSCRLVDFRKESERPGERVFVLTLHHRPSDIEHWVGDTLYRGWLLVGRRDSETGEFHEACTCDETGKLIRGPVGILEEVDFGSLECFQRAEFVGEFANA